MYCVTDVKLITCGSSSGKSKHLIKSLCVFMMMVVTVIFPSQLNSYNNMKEKQKPGRYLYLSVLYFIGKSVYLHR